MSIVLFEPDRMESIRTALTVARTSPTVLAYVGPDQMMPVASILATIMGFLLIFWHKLLAMLRRIARLFRRSEGDAPSSSPSDAPAKKPLGKS